MLFEIIPFTGFDKIKLGQNREQVEKLLGSPSEKFEEIYPDGSWAYIYSYPHFGVDCTFDSEEDFLLSSIAFFKSEFTYNKIEFIGLKERNLHLLAVKAGINDLKQEADFNLINSKDFFSESTGLSFWVTNGKVDSITVFPQYSKEHNSVIWPK